MFVGSNINIYLKNIKNKNWKTDIGIVFEYLYVKPTVKEFQMSNHRLVLVVVTGVCKAK